MPTSIVDICNRALSEIGTQSTISSLADPSPEGVNCNLWYDELREQLLRSAPWGFARYQVALTQIGDAFPDNTAPYPFLFKYAYPTNCMAVRYMLRTPLTFDSSVIPYVGQVGMGCGIAPSRANRYLVATDFDDDNNQIKVILTNIPAAIAVYTLDVTDPNIFDSMFRQALTSALAYKLCIPLSGNVGMRDQFAKSAENAILQARAADGNEAQPTTDHTPDWIRARGVPAYAFGNGSEGGWGQWTDGYTAMNWGM